MSAHNIVKSDTLQHYIKVFFPNPNNNSEFTFSDVYEIEKRPSDEDSWINRDCLSKFLPEGAIGLLFFDKPITATANSTIVGMKQRFSPRVFLGTAYTLNEIQSQFPEEARIIVYMIHNNCKRALRTDAGFWVPLDLEDIVV